jgi:putative MATE family efflux protein
VQALYNTVDRIFIGNGVGALALAGVAVSFPFMLIGIAFGVLVFVGAMNAVSISLGQGRTDDAERVLGTAVTLLTVVAVGVTAAGLAFLDPLLRLFGASDEVLPYARAFLRIILLGQIFSYISFGVNNLIRAEGSPRVAMITMILAAAANAGLNPLFIFVFRMGIQGSALATLLAQALGSAWVLSYYLSGRSRLRIRRAYLRLDPQVIRRILPLGIAPAAMQLAAALLNAVMNNQLHRYGGDLAVSARGVIYTVDVLFFMVMIGIAQGSQPIIGYNHGARRPDRVRRATGLAIAAATVIATVVWLGTRLFPAQLIGLFNRDTPGLLELGVRGLTLTFLLMPIVGFQMTSANYFLAVGKAGRATVLNLARQLLVIPGLLLLPLAFGLDGVFAAVPVADALSAILGVALFVPEWRRLKALPTGAEPAAEPAVLGGA